jgi:hypothetical protein
MWIKNWNLVEILLCVVITSCAVLLMCVLKNSRGGVVVSLIVMYKC